MDLINLLRLLYRRKLVVIPAILLSVFMIGVVYKLGAPTYRAGGSILLLPPDDTAPAPAKPNTPGTTVDSNNPYAKVGDLSVVADVTTRVMQSEPVATTLRTQGLKGTYTVGTNVLYYQGPIVDISAEATTATDAIHSARLVMDEAERQLTLLQAAQGTSPQYFIKTTIIVPPSQATTVFSSTLRRLIAVAVVGLIFILCAGISAETLSTWRAGRRKRTADQTSGNGLTAPAGGDTEPASPRHAPPEASQPYALPVGGRRAGTPVRSS